jgi:hypothetical protein
MELEPKFYSIIISIMLLGRGSSVILQLKHLGVFLNIVTIIKHNTGAM